MDENNFPNIFEETKNLQPLKKRIERSKSNFIVAGVCAGIGNYFNIEPSLIRIFALMSLLLGNWIITAYLIAALLLPLETSMKILNDYEKAKQNKINSYTIISGVLIFTGLYWELKVIGLIRNADFIFNQNSYLMNITFIILGIYLIIKNKNEDVISFNVSLPTKTKKKILGASKSLSEYLNIDSALIRAYFILGSIATIGIITLLYFLLSLDNASKLDVKSNEVNTLEN